MMARKGGLGKGLDALLPTEESETPAVSGEKTSYIPINTIIPNPRQPRHTMSEEGLEELAASIREHGILQPLLVTHEPQTGQYVLVAGERRLRAAKLAGLEAVPILEREATEQQRLELALIENVQRADLSPLETAEAYRQLSEEFSLSHEIIAQRVGKSRVAITNTLRLLKLPEVVRQAIADETITEGHARALLGLNNSQSQADTLAIILKQGLNVRRTEELVRKKNEEQPVRPPQPAASPEVSDLEQRLRSSLGTKVSMRHGKKGGSIVIYYYSNEELDAIIAQLTRG